MTNEYGKKSIGKWIVIYVIVAVVVYAAVYYFFFAKSGTGYNSTAYQNTSSANSVASAGPSNNAAQVKFADTADYQYAYLISTNSYNANTQAALAGFKVNRTVLADGTQQINLVAQNPEYKNQSYTVKPGQSLYFIDRFLQDDSAGAEANPGDDTAVLVDANGYIVQ